jgi:hypothetical protein
LRSGEDPIASIGDAAASRLWQNAAHPSRRSAGRCVLPPFEIEIALERWWLPGPPVTE